jgi:hypothetical protein
MRVRQANREAYSQQASLSLDYIDKIKVHPLTQIICYPSFRESFEYVDSLFPEAGVKEAIIYKVDKRFLDKCGYKGVGGFYNKIAKVVVITDSIDSGKKKGKLWEGIIATITDDEVIVHELLHYVSDTQIKGGKSLQLEEEFAYGNSVAYLRKKGYDDDYIIKHNFLPYLINVIDKKIITRDVLSAAGISFESLKKASPEKQKNTVKKHEKEIFERSVQEATRMGRELVELYTRTSVPMDQIHVDNGSKKFSMIDL